MITFPGFKRAIKQYEKRAHWEPSYALTTYSEHEPFSLSEGCECTVTTNKKVKYKVKKTKRHKKRGLVNESYYINCFDVTNNNDNINGGLEN